MSEQSPFDALDQLLDANNRGDGNPLEDYKAYRVVREALESRDALLEACRSAVEFLDIFEEKSDSAFGQWVQRRLLIKAAIAKATT